VIRSSIVRSLLNASWKSPKSSQLTVYNSLGADMFVYVFTSVLPINSIYLIYLIPVRNLPSLESSGRNDEGKDLAGLYESPLSSQVVIKTTLEGIYTLCANYIIFQLIPFLNNPIREAVLSTIQPTKDFF